MNESMCSLLKMGIFQCHVIVFRGELFMISIHFFHPHWVDTPRRPSTAKPWRRLHGLLEESWLPIAGTHSCYLKCFAIWYLAARWVLRMAAGDSPCCCFFRWVLGSHNKYQLADVDPHFHEFLPTWTARAAGVLRMILQPGMLLHCSPGGRSSWQPVGIPPLQMLAAFGRGNRWGLNDFLFVSSNLVFLGSGCVLETHLVEPVFDSLVDLWRRVFVWDICTYIQVMQACCWWLYPMVFMLHRYCRSFLATFPEDTLPVRSAFCSSPWTAFSLGTHHLHS